MGSRKILMVAMSMNIGGAETHIYELVKYLHSQGEDIILVSAGGAYADKLSEIGVTHIFAPLHSRGIASMLKSYRILRKLIKSVKPDIVHSHARIPSFIAAPICRRAKVPLVTTVHGNFSVSFPLKHFTNWGDYVLTVSDDVKEYLIRHYNYPEAKIKKTVNAVNRETFNSDRGDMTVRNEFGIGEKEKVILTTSRLDRQASYAAYRLIDISEELCRLYPDSRIVIAGDGEVYGEIKSLAEEKNGILGRDYIILTGRRSDIYNFTKTADVFAGISRAALEAASSEVPVILCGDYGWLGRIGEHNIADCVKTNFTCRGFGYPADVNAALLEEIKFCLDETNREIIECDIKAGAALIDSNYSVGRMAADAVEAYETSLMRYKPCDCVVTGYYGHKNMGDDALLFTILNNIQSNGKKLKVKVLSSAPKPLSKRLERYFPYCEAKYMFNIFSVRKALKKAEIFIFGGGTLIQDNTSTRSLIAYLFLLRTAQKSGCRTFLYANGIGVKNPKNIEKVRKVLCDVTYFTIRDKESYEFLLGIGIDKAKVSLTADEALTIAECGLFNVRNDLYGREKTLCVCVRGWQAAGENFYREFTSAIKEICGKYSLRPVFIVMEPQRDKFVSNRAADILNAEVIEYRGNMNDALSVYASCEYVIAMRLHSLIFGLVYGKPVVGISYDPKVKNSMAHLFASDKYVLELDGFDKRALVGKFDDVYENKAEIIKEIDIIRREGYEAAKENAEIFAGVRHG